MPSITPAARSLLICDGHITDTNGKTRLEGLFNSISPPSYPYSHHSLCVFAQLAGGLGPVTILVKVVDAAQDTTVFAVSPRVFEFPSRLYTMQLAFTINDCPFPKSGVYIFELYCNSMLVADVPIELA